MVLRAILTFLVSLFCLVLAAADQTVTAGDKVKLSCEEEPSLNRDYTITKDGLILVDFLGAVKISGLTESQAAEKISTKLVEDRILRKATIRLQVIRSVQKSIRFVGAVKTTGETPHKPGTRLADIVKLAGPTDATDLTHVTIRSEAGKSTIVDFSAYDGKDQSKNPLIEPGDEITFSAKARPDEVTILGAVGKPGVYVFAKGMTVRKAVTAAGGFVAMADLTKVKLERENTAPIIVDLSKPGYDMEITANDKVVVPLAEKREYLRVEGAVFRSGPIEYVPGMTLLKAIRAAGGTVKGARTDRVKLIPKAPGKKTLTLDLGPIEQGLTGDIPVEPGDRIEVPAPRRRGFSFESIAIGGLLFLILGR